MTDTPSSRLQTPAAALADALSKAHLNIDLAGSALESMSAADRLKAIRQIGASTQARLFDAAQGRRVELAHVVPADFEPLRPVICEGKNSLLAFTQFQKRFCRSPENPTTELYGYNHQAMSWLTGPGYFVAHQEGDEIAIDYTSIPPQAAPGWPKIASNDGFPNRLAFGGLVDYLRSISPHVTIGRATRRGKALDNWFILDRQDA